MGLLETLTSLQIRILKSQAVAARDRLSPCQDGDILGMDITWFGHQSRPPPLSSSGGSSGSSRMGLQEQGMEAGADSTDASVAASQALAAGVAVDLATTLGEGAGGGPRPLLGGSLPTRSSSVEAAAAAGWPTHRWPQHSQDESGSLSDQSLCIVFSVPPPGDLAEDQGPAQVARGAVAADPPSSSSGQQQQPPGQQAPLWRQISAHESVLVLPESLPAQQAGSCSPRQVQATEQAEQPAQSSGQGAAGTGAGTTCPQQIGRPLVFQRQELAAASLASSASSVSLLSQQLPRGSGSVSLLSQQLPPGSGSLSGPLSSSLAGGRGLVSAGSESLAAQSEPVRMLQPHYGAAAAARQQVAAQVVVNQESSSSLGPHEACGGGKQGPDSLGGSMGSHQRKPPLSPAHTVEDAKRAHSEAAAVLLGSWADRVTHLSLRYDSTAAAAARKALRQRAAAARVQVAPAATPADLRHMSPAGSADMGQGPSVSPFAGAVGALSSSSSSSRGSPAAGLLGQPNGKQAACITRRWSTGEPVCRPQPDRAVLRWRTDFVRRWRQCQEQAVLQGQGILPLTSSPPSTELLTSELPAHFCSDVHSAARQHGSNAAVLQALQRRVKQPEPQAVLPRDFSLASLLDFDDHTH